MEMQDHSTARVFTTSAIRLPEQKTLRREIPKKCIRLVPESQIEYDDRTLFYDYFYDRGTGKLDLFGPKLLNLRKYVSEAKFLIDGRIHAKYKLSEQFRLTRITVDVGTDARRILCQFPSFEYDLLLRSDESDMLASRNVLLTISKDNDLEWIKSWMVWHRQKHGASAALIVDNASTKYSTEEVLSMVESVFGAGSGVVVTCPLPHSPSADQVTHRSSAAFLQIGMLNAMNRRFLSKSRCVLSLDVDEIVDSFDGSSIFDRTVRSKVGYCRIPGEWRFSRSFGESFPRYKDHCLVADRAPKVQPKYCYVPQSKVTRFGLRVHSIGLLKRFPFLELPNFRFWHLAKITTSWKSGRAKQPTGSISIDRRLELEFESVFGGT